MALVVLCFSVDPELTLRQVRNQVQQFKEAAIEACAYRDG